MAAVYNIPYVVGMLRDAETIFNNKKLTQRDKHFMLHELLGQLHPQLGSCPVITNGVKSAVTDMLALVNYKEPVTDEPAQSNAEASA